MPTVLFLTADSAMAGLLKRLLAQHGFTVEAAASAEAAQRALGPGADALLLDLDGPDDDGFALLRRMREAGERRPIVALSARREDPVCIRALNLGADDFILKPFNYLVVAARLDAALRRCAVGPDEAPAPDGLDADQRVLRLGGRAVPLTATEFRVVEALVRRAGLTVSRGELAALIDDEGRAPDPDRVVDQHLSRLRTKLEADPKAPTHLLTVRGVGYRFTW